MFKFLVTKTDCTTNARAGVLMGDFGAIATPTFMPVATHACIKTLIPKDLEELDIRLVLSNALHLTLRPGVDVIQHLGGLKSFMGYDGGILTDSGGYQIVSLSPLCKIFDDGIVFRSHINGDLHRLTPSDVVRIQEVLKSDIHMPLDHPLGYPASFDEAKDALDRTNNWLDLSLKAKNTQIGALFAIVQGSVFPELRRRACQFASDRQVEGFALGGLSLGEPKALMWDMVSICMEELEPSRPRYLMGVGKPVDLIEGVKRGIDLFDCIIPTRIARNGQLFTSNGVIRLKHAVHKKSDAPLDTKCNCYTCKHFSLGYLAHLYNAQEPSVLRLNTIHNLSYYMNLMVTIRKTIRDGTFEYWRKSQIERVSDINMERN